MTNTVSLPLRPPSPFQALGPAEDGGLLLDEIAAAVCRHVVLPVGAAELIALFAAHTHAHDAAQFSPILGIESPTTGCGKTTLLRVLAGLTPAPLSTFNITPAGLFRATTLQKHTLLIDEADSYLLGDNMLRGILNGGHARDSALVVRANGVFDVWCPRPSP